ncbi:MAG: hypothetical protein KAJ14_02400, partial [Candidatus Omnitrophica bacterium]|nr:hypothetical protein [Candidatus Omnitrophota bacterium]
MPRIARVVGVGLPHHITQRGNYRQQIFKEQSRRSGNNKETDDKRPADSGRQFYRKNGEKIKEGLISENKGQAEKERQKRNG